MRSAVFLDRDGTINEDVDVLRDVAQLLILPGAAEGIRSLHDADFVIIVVTNQAVIARGWIDHAYLDAIHHEMKRLLSGKGAHIDAIYYCPHHPHADVEQYRMVCDCRKPGVQLIEQAIKEFDIDRATSFMIGDRTSDIEAGRRAGLKTILVKTGVAGKDGGHQVTPDLIANDLEEASKLILGTR